MTPASRNFRQAAAGVALAASLAVLTGCPANRNDSLLIGGTVPVGTHQPSPLASRIADPAPELPVPTLLGVRRDNWRETVFLIPVANVEHTPTFAAEPNLVREQGRQRGGFPDVESVTQYGSQKNDQMQALEMLTAPAYALADVALFIPRLFVHHPLEDIESPRQGYQRAPGYELEVLHPVPQPTARIVPLPPLAEPPAPEEAPAPERDETPDAQVSVATPEGDTQP